MSPDGEITPRDLKARLDAGTAPDLLDVRDPWEHELVALPGARLIPLDQLEGRADELAAARELVVYCHHGVRSAAAAQWLRHLGIPAVSLQGGIDAWAVQVAPQLRRY
jgi:rhodanese-related sulfurtransferase